MKKWVEASKTQRESVILALQDHRALFERLARRSLAVDLRALAHDAMDCADVVLAAVDVLEAAERGDEGDEDA